jgi:hypothetical protein
MSQRVYRVCRAIHARLDGEGAKRVGGRWNSPGHPVVYMAQSISLAVLENLVHMSKEDFPVGFVAVRALIPDDLDIPTEDDVEKDLPDAGPRGIRRSLAAILYVGGTPCAFGRRSRRVQFFAESEASGVRADRSRTGDTLRFR